MQRALLSKRKVGSTVSICDAGCRVFNNVNSGSFPRLHVMGKPHPYWVSVAIQSGFFILV